MPELDRRIMRGGRGRIGAPDTYNNRIAKNDNPVKRRYMGRRGPHCTSVAGDHRRSTVSSIVNADAAFRGVETLSLEEWRHPE